MKEIIKISVRELIEFVLSSGDLESGFISNTRALEGTRLHKKIQEENANLYKDFQKEVVLSDSFFLEELELIVEGRADGIIIENDKIIIEEIKSTRKPFLLLQENINEMHYAQVAFYGYFYCKINSLDSIILRITYVNVDTEEVISIDRSVLYEELKKYINSFIEEYKPWAEYIVKHNSEKNTSLKSLEFPFENYRKGQRELAISVYRTEKERKKAFIQAPTGIGKTISTIFPTLKFMGEGNINKLFYLTAKTITRTVAEEALKLLIERKAKLNIITITAKEKVCFKEEVKCDPEYCEYAKDFYSKVKICIKDMLESCNDIYKRERIEEYSNKYKVCPFELSLSLANWCDVIICDYNYAFDPSISLGILEDPKGKYSFLIDEAHNLVDRAREMYSAILNCDDIIKKLRDEVGRGNRKLNDFLKQFKESIDLLREEMKCYKESYLFIDEGITEIAVVLKKVLLEVQNLILAKRCKNEEEMIDLYFDLNKFLNIAALYEDSFRIYAILNEDYEININIYCINPSKYIFKGMKKALSSIVFSATLSPINYYKDLLIGDNETYKLKFDSPFDEKNLKVLLAPVSTRYRDRDRNKDIIVDYLYEFINNKVGNYIVFFPSYEYMELVYKQFKKKYKESNISLAKQSKEMDEISREKFLKKFKKSPKKTLLGFCVLGGLFSEGIDLTGDRLIGVTIVGVGIPQINLDNNLIKEYFSNKGENGYNYAYIFPGMNKVIQAAGRVIRTKDDKGIVLLIDDRYSQGIYKSLIPENWRPVEEIGCSSDLRKIVREFWEK